MFQWGRKDPFLGSSSIDNSIPALSTGLWTSTSEKVSQDATQKNPMSFYTGNGYWTKNHLPAESWDVNKTFYDPCPVGWKVPKGGDAGVWNIPAFENGIWNPQNKGILVTVDTLGYEIWYPAAGELYGYDGSLGLVGAEGYYWAYSVPADNTVDADRLVFSQYNGSLTLNPFWYGDRPNAYPVRCCKEQ